MRQLTAIIEGLIELLHSASGEHSMLARMRGEMNCWTTIDRGNQNDSEKLVWCTITFVCFFCLCDMECRHRSPNVTHWRNNITKKTEPGLPAMSSSCLIKWYGVDFVGRDNVQLKNRFSLILRNDNRSLKSSFRILRILVYRSSKVSLWYHGKARKR